MCPGHGAMSRLRWLVLTLLALGSIAAVASAEIAVRITSPEAGETLFDEVEVAVQVIATEPIVRVDVHLDGVLIETLRQPPFRVTVDVGEENRERLIEVTAKGRSGAVGQASLLAPRLVVHDQLAVDLQQLYVTVVDRDGQRVLDLEQQDFRVLDAKQPQEIVTFERGDIPFTAVVLVDGSFSMRGQRLRASLLGARRFVEGMRPLDEAKLMVVSDRLLEITPWSSVSRPLAHALENVEAGGGTAILDYLYMALNLLESRQGRRVVILLSDGWDAQSVLSAEQLRRVARRSQALIYWVRLAGDEPGFGRELSGPRRNPLIPVRLLPTSSWHNERASRRLYGVLEKTVRESGGRVESVPSIGSIVPTFADVLAELREQYALGYDPDPRRNDGSWRSVEVELVQRGLKVRAREGYVDR